MNCDCIILNALDFLQKGYAVIYFHREESLKPFSRNYANLFGHLDVTADGTVVVNGFGNLSNDVKRFKQFSQQILFIPFIRIDQYLHSLEAICKVTASIGSRALV